MTPETAEIAPKRGLTGLLSSLRLITAWALLGYTALFLMFEFLELVLPGDGSLVAHAARADFRSWLTMALPLLAVLIATYIAPSLPSAKVVAAVALFLYAVALFFGVVTLLIGVGAVLPGGVNVRASLGAFRYLVIGVADLLLITLAGLFVYRAFTSAGRR